MGYSEMLMSELPKDDPRHTKLSVIKGAAERAANLTRQLLSFSRKQMLDMKIIDLNRVLTDFERILRTTIREDVERPCASARAWVISAEMFPKLSRSF
jgi:two-component system cell cycle sensor histidine kinase/response regulator CckA